MCLRAVGNQKIKSENERNKYLPNRSCHPFPDKHLISSQYINKVQGTSGINKAQIIRCFRNVSRSRPSSLHVALKANQRGSARNSSSPAADFYSLQRRHQSAVSDDCRLDTPATLVMAKPERRKPSRRKADEVEASTKTNQSGGADPQLARTYAEGAPKKVPSSAT